MVSQTPPCCRSGGRKCTLPSAYRRATGAVVRQRRKGACRDVCRCGGAGSAFLRCECRFMRFTCGLASVYMLKTRLYTMFLPVGKRLYTFSMPVRASTIRFASQLPLRARYGGACGRYVRERGRAAMARTGQHAKNSLYFAAGPCAYRPRRIVPARSNHFAPKAAFMLRRRSFAWRTRKRGSGCSA